MVSFFKCPVLVKSAPMFGDHQMGEDAGDSEVPARGRKLLETARTAGNQYCYMSHYSTKYSDNNHLPVY